MQSATPSTRSSLILDQAVTVSSLDNHGKSMLVPSKRSEPMQRNGPAFAIKRSGSGNPRLWERRNDPTSPNKNGPEGQASGPFERIGGVVFVEWSATMRE